MPKRSSPLSDPEYAAFAWARYRRVLRWVTLVAIACVLAAIAWLRSEGAMVSIPELIATIAGVGLSVMLAGALMGLIFLSSGTGHDADVAAFAPDEDEGSKGP